MKRSRIIEFQHNIIFDYIYRSNYPNHLLEKLSIYTLYHIVIIRQYNVLYKKGSDLLKYLPIEMMYCDGLLLVR